MTEKRKLLRRAIHDKQNPYLMVKRTTAQDRKLSYEALGMLVYVLSQRDDWCIQPNELVTEGCGRDKVYRILKELMKNKYIEHEKSFDTQHKIVWGDYIVHEYPITQNPDTENQEVDLGEKPFTENPDTENTHSNKYGDGKLKSSTRKRSTPHTSESIHPLIQAWAEARNIDSVNIGAPIYTTKDLAAAKRMDKWELPATCEEVKRVVKTSTAPKYRFDWLESDIPKARLSKSHRPAKVYDDPAMDLSIPMPNILSKLQQSELERKAHENA